MSPKAFDDCIKNNGKVRTKKLKNGRYMKICYDKEGNSYPGEIKKKAEARVMEDSKRLKEGLLKLMDHFKTHYHND